MSMTNPYSVVHNLEKLLSEYSGSKYAVAVESGSAAILLSLFWFKQKHGSIGTVNCPKYTYPSIPCSIILMGGKVNFTDEKWSGTYQLNPYPIVDGALRFKKNMYSPGTFHMVSMHIRKHIPVGRGGAILLDDEDAYNWLKRARFDGRGPMPLQEDDFTQLGFNMYMEPANAARAIQLIQALGDRELPDLRVEDQKYPDLSQFPVYGSKRKYNVLDKYKRAGIEWTIYSVNYAEEKASIAAPGYTSMIISFSDLDKYKDL